MTTVFVPRERAPGERRVAATPETVRKLCAAGLAVTVEAGAGEAASLVDQAFVEAGAITVEAGPEDGADVVLCVAAPRPGEPAFDALRQGSLLVGLLDPYDNTEFLGTLRDRGVTTLAMELIPRITRAQPMDALSSQASIAGYKAVLLAAARLDRYFPLLMTAAGTIPPARVVIMGGGVAGLQAVATAKRLGAVVEVSDIRPEVEEQVASLGGRFIALPDMEAGSGEGGYARQMGEDFLARQREIVKRHLAAANVVICTAQVPGKKAPILVTRDMVEAMRPGAVIVDLAAPQGGNCELTRLEEETRHHGVILVGPLNLPSTMAHDASVLYARNLHHLLAEMLDDGRLTVDLADEVLAGAVVTHQGRTVHPRFSHVEEEAAS